MGFGKPTRARQKGRFLLSKNLESQVWRSALKGELKPIAAVMADMGNDDGRGIYPSVAYLAWLLSTSERAIQNKLKELNSIGIVRRVTNKEGGRGLVPRYRLYANKLPKRISWQELRKGEHSAPFSESPEIKGEEIDAKRVQNSTVKGAEFAPDPLVEPSVDPLDIRAPRDNDITKWIPYLAEKKKRGQDVTTLIESVASSSLRDTLRAWDKAA